MAHKHMKGMPKAMKAGMPHYDKKGNSEKGAKKGGTKKR